jgi:hypothetical protein
MLKYKVTYLGSWPIIAGSGFDDWIYKHLHLQSLLITINYSAIANVPTSQITRAHYPFPGNRFITGPITSNHYEVFLPFPAVANSKDSAHFSSDYCSVFLKQLPASEFASLITTLCRPNGNTSLYCWSPFTAPLLSSGLPIVVTCLSGKVFNGPLPSNWLPIVACMCGAGMRLASRCLAMGIHITIILNR